MQLRQMPRGGQISLKGNVVNVPSDVSGTIKSLPRMIDENETIMLKLKRRLSYKYHVAFENIRPDKVFQAARWLVTNSTLFQNEGISVNETWLHESRTGVDANDSSFQDDAENQNESDDGWTEDDGFADRLTGNLDTFLQAADFREFICYYYLLLQVKTVLLLVFFKISNLKYCLSQLYFVANRG
jgi:hypothetical protein